MLQAIEDFSSTVGPDFEFFSLRWETELAPKILCTATKEFGTEVVDSESRKYNGKFQKDQ